MIKMKQYTFHELKARIEKQWTMMSDQERYARVVNDHYTPEENIFIKMTPGDSVVIKEDNTYEIIRT